MAPARPVMFLFACALVLLACSSFATAAIVEHTFNVQNLTVNRLCRNQVITAVNGSLPGPILLVNEGDTVIIHVFNKSPYNMTIHWHGVFQLGSAWADGPEYVTQCPIQPGQSYTYKFNIIGQEGTLWWHAHAQWLRATVHGALIIRPTSRHSYPFPKPYREVPIILGEWWNANVFDVANKPEVGGPNISDAYTINGQPGDLYPCSSNHTYTIEVVQGKTYLLRIINAALNNQLFFKIANHSLTVVAADALYTNPYVTDVVLVAPGQTTDVLVKFNQTSGRYYMAASAYNTIGVSFDNTSTTGIITYHGSTPSNPIMPLLPACNDTNTAYKFSSDLTGLDVMNRFWNPCPCAVDERMFVTIGMSNSACDDDPGNATCPFGQIFSASMNNVSFQLPRRMSLLEAYFKNISGIYTTDFPNNPPLQFDYTNPSNALNQTLIMTQKATKVKKVKYNAIVEMVLQNTALIEMDSHPMHLHGFDFYVLAQGFGNYNASIDSKKFNLVNPHKRNTIGVPVGGWAVIRFRANNPGVWLMHCHMEMHMPPIGLATAFIVEDGPTPSTRLPPPPPDLPKC